MGKKLNCLTIEQKNKFIELALLPEILGHNYQGLLSQEDRAKVLDDREIIMKVLENTLLTMTIDVLTRLKKEIRGLKFIITRNGEPKKSERIINSWDLETVLEHSMQCCVNCNRNHKECRLNEAFKKLNIPVADDEQTGCKYRIVWEEEK